jgi:Ca2+-transporting ATPase
MAEAIRGLTDAEVLERRSADGFNELPRPDQRTVWKIIIELIRDPMLGLLLGASVIYLVLGDLKDALILLIFAAMSVAITVVQEKRTERVLEALRDLTSPRALVIRNGERVRIPGREVVRDDIVLLGEGDRVPADALLMEATELMTDESLLTGESVPVRKVAAEQPNFATVISPGGDDLAIVFSGSLVVRGSGIARVTASGIRSEIGKIGHSLSQLDMEPPRLRKQTQRLTQLAALAGGAVSVLVVLLYGLLRSGWLEAVLAGIAIGMSLMPAEIPVILAVFMAMGAWRISRARVLTRRAAAIETLGSATVLCTDKTGTLTENRMTVAAIVSTGGDVFRLGNTPLAQISLQARRITTIGVLASAPVPFDPMERAFHELAQQIEPEEREAPSGKTLVKSYGLRPDLLAVANVWRLGSDLVVAAKGAPEAIAGICRLPQDERAELTKRVKELADDGLRVLAVARGSYPTGRSLPDRPDGFALELVGLIGLADPVRPTVPAAVAECRQAGIKVIMITGDHPSTARSIAVKAGIEAGDVVTGDELTRLSDADLAVRVQSATVFARIMPEQKLRIVNAIKANGEIVGMTGDGVNDAPSLKAAHIGIAMGGRGTDVAREASSIVLLDDDFGSIAAAVRLGRRIYDNLRKAMGFIFAVHVPIAGLALMPPILGLPILLTPVHIALLQLIIDPVCSLVFEAETEEEDIMRRMPRSPTEPLFSHTQIGWSIAQGLLAFALVAAVFLLANHRLPEAEVRSLTFFSLVTAIIGLVLVNRAYSSSILAALQRPNAALAWVLIAVAGMLALTMLWPPLRTLARFGPLHARDIAITLIEGLAVLMLLEWLKHFWFRRSRN